MKTQSRTPSNPQDIAARRAAFQRFRKGIPHIEIARLTGLTVHTVRSYSAPAAPNVAATWPTIEVLRQEAIRRARKVVGIAESELFRREIELQKLERMELPSSGVAVKSASKPAASVAGGRRVAAQEGRVVAASGSGPHQPSCQRLPAPAGPAQI